MNPIAEMIKDEIEVLTEAALEARYEGHKEIERENLIRVAALKKALRRLTGKAVRS